MGSHVKRVWDLWWFQGIYICNVNVDVRFAHFAVTFDNAVTLHVYHRSWRLSKYFIGKNTLEVKPLKFTKTWQNIRNWCWKKLAKLRLLHGGVIFIMGSLGYNVLIMKWEGAINILFKLSELGQAALYWNIWETDCDSNGLKRRRRLTEAEERTATREDTSQFKCPEHF